MSLFDDLSKLAKAVIQHRDKMNDSEATTEQVSVLPFIDALGYKTNNPDEVRKQYPILNMDAVDFAILRDDAPIMVLEAKKASENLDKHWKQLFQYFNADKARIGILTNGVLYRFYTDMQKPNIMDEQPFLEIDMLKLDQQKVDILEGFTKARFDPIKSIHYMKIRSKVARELQNPADWLVKHFIWGIHAGSKGKKVIEEYRPLVVRAIDEYVARQSGVTPPPPPPKPKPTQPAEGFIPIYGYYDGHKFEAELLRDTLDRGLQIARHHIRYNGITTWLKNAAVIAIQSVDPSFEPTRTYPNGFHFWHVVDPADGTEHMIRAISGWDNITDEALRQRVMSL